MLGIFNEQYKKMLNNKKKMNDQKIKMNEKIKKMNNTDVEKNQKVSTCCQHCKKQKFGGAKGKL